MVSLKALDKKLLIKSVIPNAHFNELSDSQVSVLFKRIFVLTDKTGPPLAFDSFTYGVVRKALKLRWNAFGKPLQNFVITADIMDRCGALYSVTGSVVESSIASEQATLPYRTASGDPFHWDVVDASDPTKAYLVPREDPSLTVSAILLFRSLRNLDFSAVLSLPVVNTTAPSSVSEGEAAERAAADASMADDEEEEDILPGQAEAS